MIRRPGSRVALFAVALLMSGLGGVGAAVAAHTSVTPTIQAAVMAAPTRPGLAPVAPHPTDVLARVDRNERDVTGRRALLCVAIVLVLCVHGARRRYIAAENRPRHERSRSALHLRAPPLRSLPRLLTTA